MPSVELKEMNSDAIKLFVFCYELSDFKAMAARIERLQNMRSVCPRDWVRNNDSNIEVLVGKLYVKDFLQELTTLLSVNFPYGSVGSTRFDSWLRKFFTEQKEQYDDGLITMDELMYTVYESMKAMERKMN